MKEPKEEAERIIEMFYNKNDISVIYTDIENDTAIATGYMTYKNAKQCAILHVNGIIKELTEVDRKYYTDGYILDKLDHWQEVLQIIKDK